MTPILKQKKGGPVSWGDARLVKKRKKKKGKAYYKNKNKRKTLTEIERLRQGIGCARGSQLKVIEEPPVQCPPGQTRTDADENIKLTATPEVLPSASDSM